MNYKGMASRLGIEEDDFLEIMNLFVETSYSDLEKLESAIEGHDFRKAVEAAHSIKGAAANLGLAEIFEISKTVETKACKKNLNGAMEMVRGIREKLDRIAQGFHGSKNAMTML